MSEQQKIVKGMSEQKCYLQRAGKTFLWDAFADNGALVSRFTALIAVKLNQGTVELQERW